MRKGAWWILALAARLALPAGAFSPDDFAGTDSGHRRYKRANHRLPEEAYLTDGPPLER